MRKLSDCHFDFPNTVEFLRKLFLISQTFEIGLWYKSLLVNQFQANVSFLLYSLGMSEYLDFLTFSGGLEVKCWGISMNFVGNKAKVWISKRVLQENKARQISRKTNISYPLIRTCVTGFRNFSFLEDFAKILEDYTKWITPWRFLIRRFFFG